MTTLWKLTEGRRSLFRHVQGELSFRWFPPDVPLRGLALLEGMSEQDVKEEAVPRLAGVLFRDGVVGRRFFLMRQQSVQLVEPCQFPCPPPFKACNNSVAMAGGYGSVVSLSLLLSRREFQFALGEAVEEKTEQWKQQTRTKVQPPPNLCCFADPF